MINTKAFSLLEATVVVIILTILASAAIPVLSREFMEKAANKTALDMNTIEEAARAYYVNNNGWPNNIAALQSGNYLPSQWNGINPFGVNSGDLSQYAYNVYLNGSTFTVYTYVPAAAEPIIQNVLPTTWINGNDIYSSTTPPGNSSAVPSGAILMWSGTISNIPSGWVLCDGTNGTPDLRDRFVVGASQDSGGVAMTTVTGSLTQSGNGQLPATADSVSATSSSDSLCHYGGLDYTSNGCTAVFSVNTNGFGTGSLNIAVYYALAYIMKT